MNDNPIQLPQVHVAIDTRIPDIGLGGVQQVIRSLAQGFREMDSSKIKRTWIVYENTHWWQDVVPAQDFVISTKAPLGGYSLRLASKFPRLISTLYPWFRLIIPETPFLDKQLRDRGVTLVHLPFQDGLYTKLPFIYHPHDLQHEYLPHYFTRRQILHRNRFWRTRATRASVVMAASPGVVDDLRKFWDIDETRIALVPIPPPQRVEPEQSGRFVLNKKYIIYPAVFWPHKNHLNLLQALSILRDRGLVVQCVLCGARSGIYNKVVSETMSLGLSDSVHFIGHVSDGEYGVLLKNASCLVIPSLFEAASMTVWDAQKIGVPVACSDISSFRNQVADTALLFDPTNPADIARAIESLLSDTAATSDLIKRAHQRVEHINVRRFAEEMTAIYLQVATSTEHMRS